MKLGKFKNLNLRNDLCINLFWKFHMWLLFYLCIYIKEKKENKLNLPKPCLLRFWKGKGTKAFSPLQRAPLGNCKFLLQHFKGTKAMTRGHGGNLPSLFLWSIRPATFKVCTVQLISYWQFSTCPQAFLFYSFKGHSGHCNQILLDLAF